MLEKFPHLSIKEEIYFFVKIGNEIPYQDG